MTEFFVEYGLFLAKTLTVLVALVAVILIISSRRSHAEDGAIEITKINERYKALSQTLLEHTLPKDAYKKNLKDAKNKEKEQQRLRKETGLRRRIFVLDFDGDIRASAVTSLRKEITAILTTATAKDEVFVRLESGGGMVHSYGLAASQLVRIKKRGIPLAVSVDKVAASGGYMMACVADRILAAPFSIIGSIGVVAQIPNFHRLLKKKDIDFELITAGEYKRTLTLFGENTDSARAKFKHEIDETHQLFKNFITENRPQVDIEKVATGEHWHGVQAIGLKLVDELITSDDYLFAACETSDVYEVKVLQKRKLGEKISEFFTLALDRVLGRVTQ